MFNISLIKAFQDNYIFLLTDEKGEFTAVVDPGDASPVIESLGHKNLDAILLTHHHNDHIGGVHTLVNQYNCAVYGARRDQHRLPPLTQALSEGETLRLGESTFQVLETDGHTLGHISYYFPEEDALFCGDTLFSGGCGKLFEGSAEDLFNSFVKYKKLPLKTNIYCAHEYTKTNLTFLLNEFPEDINVQKKYTKSVNLRACEQATIPSTLEAELTFNKFLTAPSIEKLADLRQKKDNF